MSNDNDNKHETSSNSTVWERKGNLTSQPSRDPLRPEAEIGGSGSGEVRPSNTSAPGAQSGSKSSE